MTLSVVLIILLSSKGKEPAKIPPTATPTVEPYKSDTGAVLMTPNPVEDKIQIQTSALRNKAPIDTDTFVLDFDWKNIYFTIKPKNEKFKMFDVEKWLSGNGYGAILISNFRIIK